MEQIPPANDKWLFTPGPLTTSRTVKQAMLRDLGSRDKEFIEIVRDIRNKLLKVAGVEEGHEAILIQGSGTFAVEAILSSAIPPNGSLLVIENGAYGKRMAQIAQAHRIPVQVLSTPENQIPLAKDLEQILKNDSSITTVAAVHCETTSGILNPIQELGEVAAAHQKTYIVDSMSAFGAIPFDFTGCHIDYLATSANKCIEGAPGFGIAICKRDSLLKTEHWTRTLSLDLFAQWKGLEQNGQFRFTPPTHVILAFEQALRELEAEGGAAGRHERYKANHHCLINGMRQLGFKEYVAPELQGPIITSFRYPTDPRFQFEELYSRLSDQGFVIYPGKVSDADCFRIGTIGRIFPPDVQNLLDAIARVLRDMDLPIPLS